MSIASSGGRHSAASFGVSQGSVPSATHGGRLVASGVVVQAADQIVQEVERARGSITGVRGPMTDLKVSYDDLLARATAVRGRGLLYPYISSGLGNGALVELADGSVKWDMICGIGVNFFGHADPDLIKASIIGSIDDTLKQGNLQSGFSSYEFAETLLTEAKKHSRLKHAYLATGGAMANENALKVCIQKKFVDHLTTLGANPGAKPEQLLLGASPTPRVLAFKDCFMGRSLTMASIGDNHAGREGLPIVFPVDYMPFWDPAAAERMGKARFIDMAVDHLEQYAHRYPGQHACFIFELVQGEGGFNVGDRDYLKALMDACRRHKIAIWDDEIQTFGRLERMFAYEHFDLGEYVDVLCVGKMTQACATLWTPEFNPRSAILSGTFTGEGPSFRVGQRVIERLRDGNFYSDGKSPGLFAQHHAKFREHTRALMEKHPEWFPAVESLGGGGERLIGGAGGMMRFTPFGGVKDKVNKACKALYDEGVVLFYCGHGPFHVRMLPPLPAMKMEDWPKVFECVERGLAKASA